MNTARGNRLPDDVRTLLRSLLESGITGAQAAREVTARTGFPVTKQRANQLRVEWGIEAGRPGHSALPCGKCADPTPGRRHVATIWGIATPICDTCKAVLVRDSKQRRLARRREREREARRLEQEALDAADAAIEADDLAHAADFAARARLIRLLAARLPILDPFFGVRDLRGRAFTHRLLRRYAS